jgi:hypothetical protein
VSVLITFSCPAGVAGGARASPAQENLIHYPPTAATVRVSYQPDDPARARNLGASRERVRRILFLVVGLGLIAVAVAVGAF